MCKIRAAVVIVEPCLIVLQPGGPQASGRRPAAGLRDHTIVISLCPGGKERMWRLTSVVGVGRMDLNGVVTHRFKYNNVEATSDPFANRGGDRTAKANALQSLPYEISSTCPLP